MCVCNGAIHALSPPPCHNSDILSWFPINSGIIVFSFLQELKEFTPSNKLNFVLLQRTNAALKITNQIRPCGRCAYLFSTTGPVKKPRRWRRAWIFVGGAFTFTSRSALRSDADLRRIMSRTSELQPQQLLRAFPLQTPEEHVRSS